MLVWLIRETASHFESSLGFEFVAVTPVAVVAVTPVAVMAVTPVTFIICMAFYTRLGDI